MNKAVRRPAKLRGVITVPGDKSISHRAAIFNAIADGEATIDHFLAGADCISTLQCLRSLGVSLSRRYNRVTIRGAGRNGLKENLNLIDAGNSGTTMRLLAGLLSAQPFQSFISGDESLRARPMARVIQPLKEMGADITGWDNNTRPPIIIGANLNEKPFTGLRGITHQLPVASAQVKSSITLAALYAEGETVIEEPAQSRDHTERMLWEMGADLVSDGNIVRVKPLDHELQPWSLTVPGDLSSAAFWMVAAAVHPDAEIETRGVGINPTRSGLIEVLRAMGADIELRNERVECGEPVADIVVRSSRLRGTTIEGDIIPRLIDEVPVLAVAAALAEGETVIRDAAELRVKESDRIKTTTEELSRLGAEIEERPDGMTIRGVSELRGANCVGHGDHRLVMALAVAGLAAAAETTVAGAETAAISYPSFWEDLERLSTSQLAPSR